MSAFDELTDSFSRLPGIGKKSAARIVNYILKQDAAEALKFSQRLSVLHQKIKPCTVCGTWTETNPCPVCSDPLRDQSIICVVEQPQDVGTIEAYKEFRGLYHVLGGLIKPLEGIGPDQLSIGALVNRIQEGNVQEIIVATNPTVEGDTTALFLNKVISEQCREREVKVTRLATGIPVGGDLEYIDKRTLSLSFRGRTSF
ncbi:MAG: recombination protein RecR [Treponema sp.]|nr:recombination protein RecR [Treponema sp.]